MAKSLHDRNTTESDRIVERIENWLDHHNESKELLRDWQECDVDRKLARSSQ
ncbi:hypothetical protein DPMN_191890 [Dreissena polymorpha]|uniref:Uncharacterized protein n=1 Tax=Dreissena polymorpha TaxID=45954 RepID=A0A9D3XZI2_DREPO|nr:hypothetical protein DPMN_191890 [Dreissena polymorpha]